jgi:toxin ParE1/3/4
MKVTYRAQALGDIDEIQRYLIERNRNAAGNVIRAIYAGIQLIAERPYANPRSDDPGIRVKILQRYNYKIFYTVIGEIPLRSFMCGIRRDGRGQSELGRT